MLALRVIALWCSSNKFGIRCLKTLGALIVRVGNRKSWFWPCVSIWYNSLFNVNIVQKYSGSDLFTNSHQNFIHRASTISLTLSIFSFLSNGSVWAFYLLFVIMRRERFCSLNILFHSKTPAYHTKLQIRQIPRIILEFHGRKWKGSLCTYRNNVYVSWWYVLNASAIATQIYPIKYVLNYSAKYVVFYQSVYSVGSTGCIDSMFQGGFTGTDEWLP